METLPSDWDWDAMRAWSKVLFRNENRLPVAVLAREASIDELYAQAIADELGIDQPQVSKHLAAFVEAGLLAPASKRQPTSKPKGGRPGQRFVCTEDEFWHCLQELGNRFRRPPPKLE